MKPSLAGSDCAAAASPPSPECDDEDEPDRKKHGEIEHMTADDDDWGFSVGVLSHTHDVLVRLLYFQDAACEGCECLQILHGWKLPSRDGIGVTCDCKLKVQKLHECRQVQIAAYRQAILLRTVLPRGQQMMHAIRHSRWMKL